MTGNTVNSSKIPKIKLVNYISIFTIFAGVLVFIIWATSSGRGNLKVTSQQIIQFSYKFLAICIIFVISNQIGTRRNLRKISEGTVEWENPKTHAGLLSYVAIYSIFPILIAIFSCFVLGSIVPYIFMLFGLCIVVLNYVLLAKKIMIEARYISETDGNPQSQDEAK